jgi:hypothetical protein
MPGLLKLAHMTTPKRLPLLFRNFTVIFSAMIAGSLATHEYLDYRSGKLCSKSKREENTF